MAGHRGTVLARLERADVRRQLLGQHRHDTVGEIDAVAARPCLAVELGAGTDIEADVGDGDDRVPPALTIRFRPDRVVMVARVLWVDRDDRQMRQVLALPQRLLRHAVRLVDRFLGEFGAKPMLVDRDEAEAARSERITQDRVDPCADPRRAATNLAQHQVAGLGVLQFGDQQLAPLLLVDRRQPEALSLLLDHAKRQFRSARELLQRMSEPTVPLLLGAAKHAIADTECAASPPLDQPQPRRRGFGVPLLGHGKDVAAVVDLADAQHRHLGHPAGLVEGAATRMVDQPLVGHVVKQALQIDLVLAAKPERPGDLPLARRLVGLSDEIEDLLAARQAGGVLAGHDWPPKRDWGRCEEVSAIRRQFTTAGKTTVY